MNEQKNMYSYGKNAGTMYLIPFGAIFIYGMFYIAMYIKPCVLSQILRAHALARTPYRPLKYD